MTIRPKQLQVTIKVPAKSDDMCDETYDTYIYNIDYEYGDNPLELFVDYVNKKAEKIASKLPKIIGS